MQKLQFYTQTNVMTTTLQKPAAMADYNFITQNLQYYTQETPCDKFIYITTHQY